MKLTLPLCEEDVLLKSHRLFGKCLYEEICNLLFSGDVLELHCSFLYPVFDEVIYDLVVLGFITEYRISESFVQL